MHFHLDASVSILKFKYKHQTIQVVDPEENHEAKINIFLCVPYFGSFHIFWKCINC